jgi:hypothetical protein
MLESVTEKAPSKVSKPMVPGFLSIEVMSVRLNFGVDVSILKSIFQIFWRLDTCIILHFLIRIEPKIYRSRCDTMA